MPTAGQSLRALDFVGPATNTEATDETAFTDTTYVQGAAVCGTAFTAPTSGQVLVLWHGDFESNTADARIHLSVAVRTGAVVGSGTSVSDASDSSALSSIADAAGGTRQRISAGMWRVITGLTPGSSYNAVTEHRMAAAGNGDIFQRGIAVIPLP